MSTRILVGDSLTRLRDLPDQSVHCCVTSPPYWGLRDYGTGQWEGGDPKCEHKGRAKPRQDSSGAAATHGEFAATRGTQPGKSGYVVPIREQCLCGARRIDEQLGLEHTPRQYVEHIVDVFREVWRVLRDDGTLWLNLGDGYVGGGRGGGAENCKQRTNVGSLDAAPRVRVADLKPKDLVGIPWMVAFALRADGWYLRSDVVWAKPNPMPESVTDRPTKAHEYLFLLAKSERYYYDHIAVAEGVVSRRGSGNKERKLGDAVDRPDSHLGRSIPWEGATRNRRSVWTIAVHPFKGAHFATFPPKLVEPCIQAGTSPQACEHCGTPWKRVVERKKYGDWSSRTHDDVEHVATLDQGMSGDNFYDHYEAPKTTGWRSGCACENSGAARCVVLDPFGGAGTTALVSTALGRDAVLVELKPAYAEMARERIDTAHGVFANVTVDHGETAAA